MTNIEAWLSDLTGGESFRKIARKASLPAATLTDQIRNNRIQPETIVAISRAYGTSPLRGLVALGLITQEEADAGDLESALKRVADEYLAAEILRRIQDGPSIPLTAPMDGRHPALSVASDMTVESEWQWDMDGAAAEPERPGEEWGSDGDNSI